MAYQTYEISQYNGAPIELFRFADDVSARTWTFTTGEDAISDGSISYLPDVLSRTSIKQSSTKASDGMQIKLPSGSSLAQQFLAYLPARPIAVIAQRLQRNDAALERVTFFTGAVVTVAFESDGMATFSCQPVTKSLGKKVPWPVYKAGCTWALYEDGCGVVRTVYATPVGTYVSSGLTLSSAAIGTKPDGWFSNGYVEYPPTGERRYIISHVGDTITLNYPFLGLPIAADLVAYAGCQRTASVCSSKFSNLPNYLGFDYIPELNPYDTSFGPNASSTASGSLGSFFSSFIEKASNSG